MPRGPWRRTPPLQSAVAFVHPASCERLAFPQLTYGFFAQIEAADIRIVDDVLGCPFRQNLAGIDDVGAVGQAERLADIVVGDQYADTALRQVADQRLDVADGDRVDAGKGLSSSI